MIIDIGTQKLTSNIKNKFKILGVQFNQSWSCRHMRKQCLRLYYLFKLRPIRHYLDRPSKIKLVQSHIISRIDYSNVLYANANKGDIK